MPEIARRFIADENFPFAAVDLLRTEGFDVLWVRESCPGIADFEVLSRAVAENRHLLTLDKDFGELAFHSGLPVEVGVMLFRLSGLKPSALAQLILNGVKSVEDPTGYFVVVEPSRIRLRPLKS